ncbi:MAG: haloacid dehalogenase-like hydrolase [Patescibacteria group bacterium]|nr:haloacid dehalogenase-like hydrolase [Patescibacteria group bacterium]
MKPILFIDFDGTLCNDKFWRSIDPVIFEKIQSFLFSENKSVKHDWMKGVYSSEDINRLIAKELNVPFEKIWNVFVEDCKTMAISRNSLDRIKELRNDHIVILVTDNMDCFTRFTVPAQKLDSFFDYIINSFEVKKFKEYNEGEIFIRLADRAGTKIEDCILIDNSKNLCTLFSKLGGKSHLVTSETPLDYWLDKL